LIGTGAGVIFKGSGFYETDYKRKSPAGTAGTRDSAKADTSSDNGEAGPSGAGGSAETSDGGSKGGSKGGAKKDG
jgi:hypothetical protein